MVFEYLDSLYEEISNPLSWHWKTAYKEHWYSFTVRRISSLVSYEQLHVLEVLKRLHVSGEQHFAEGLKTKVLELERHFRSGGNIEAANAAFHVIEGYDHYLLSDPGMDTREYLRQRGYHIELDMSLHYETRAWKATKSGRTFLIKRYPPMRRGDWKRETHALRTLLNTRGVPSLILSTRQGKGFIIIEEYVGTKGLRRANAFEIRSLCRYLLQVLSILKECHKKGIVHLDVREHNIRLDGRGNVFLIDFGNAQRIVLPFRSHAQVLDKYYWPTREKRAEAPKKSVKIAHPWMDFYPLICILDMLIGEKLTKKKTETFTDYYEKSQNPDLKEKSEYLFKVLTQARKWEKSRLKSAHEYERLLGELSRDQRTRHLEELLNGTQ